MRRQFPRNRQRNGSTSTGRRPKFAIKKAEKIFQTAAYFDRRAEYRGAIHYYQQVVRDYQDTPFAEKAQIRIGEVADRPGKPEQYAPWLVDLLPKRDKIQRLLDEVEAYEKTHPRESQPEGVVESEILPAAARQPVGTGSRSSRRSEVGSQRSGVRGRSQRSEGLGLK